MRQKPKSGRSVVREFILEHEDWRKILSSPPYNINIKDGVGDYQGLVCFKYNQIESDFSQPLVQESRGLILDADDPEEPYRVVRKSFDKFFNLGEPNAAAIDWSTATAAEKIDGSLIALWWWARKKRWVVSTNGSIDAYSVKMNGQGTSLQNLTDITFGAQFHALFWDYFKGLDTKYTYTFELVSPYNQTVVYYKRPALYFIGARHRITLEEVDPKTLPLAKKIKPPKTHPLEDIQPEKLEALNKKGEAVEHEGYVVTDAKWNRVKVKTSQYLLVAHMVNKKLSLRRAVSLVKTGEASEFLAYFPDQKTAIDLVKNVIRDISREADEAWTSVRELVGDRKAFAKAAQKNRWCAYCFFKTKPYCDNATPWQWLFGGVKNDYGVEVWNGNSRPYVIIEEYYKAHKKNYEHLFTEE